jgi:(p)ppGpp synthase/HD superfamily hydrolase
VLSGNEVERLKSLRGKLAVLCPETDGLQAKHRIKRILKGKTREERVEEMLDIVADEVNVKQISMTKQVARIVSLVFDFVVFTSEEVYRILKNEYFKKFR